MYSKRGFVCQNCGVAYERNAKTSLYCSRSCSSSGINKSRTKKIVVPCEGCGKEREYSVYKESSGVIDKYCSKGCYAAHQKRRLVEQCRRIAQESRKANSEKAKQRHKEKGHPWVGRKHSKASRKKMSMNSNNKGENNPMYGKKHSLKTKEKMSEVVAQQWVEGKRESPRKFCEQGYYFSKKMARRFFYRSSWEREYYKYLDDCVNVLQYDTEVVRLPYFYEQKRWYVPDVKVWYVSGGVELQEIKPLYYCASKKNKAKFSAARKYCKIEGIRFRVLTERYLEYLGVI